MSKRGSTVVAVFDDALKILREGEISASELRQVVGA
jgi:tRNA A37 threonylcarbamoyladenosine synthetase subunit TsaC/SUA5/YrdC